ncbi:MAG: serine hydrolase [Paracoccaceae bacterium]
MTALIALVFGVLTAQVGHAQPFAAVVMDARTGEILQSTNSNARLDPASLTKMMTLYIAFEALENGEITEDTRVRISRHAASQPPSRLGLRAGQTIAFRYLIRAAALRSANDAAVAIAEALEGSVANFATRMNRTARAIGMTRTQFRNPHGLTADGHLSTARDMSILGRQLFFDYPQYYNIFSRLSDSAGIAQVSNTNRRFLQGYRGADGIKTGFTNAAGYNLTAMAERDNVRILVTVMGARSSAHRHQQVTQLMDRGFAAAPRRASVRRPARPNYVRAPEDRGSGPAAGRVIRLQAAPTRSRFPRARPDPNAPPAAPSPELLAALQEGIDEVIDEIREPAPETDTDVTGYAPGTSSEEPEEDTDAPEVAAATPDVAAQAEGPAMVLARSPLPRARPERAVSADTAAVAPAEDTADAPADVAAVSPEARPDAVTQAPSPQQFDHSPEAVAEVQVVNGVVTIPGLPPLDQAIGAAPETSPAVPDAEAALTTPEGPSAAPDFAPVLRTTSAPPGILAPSTELTVAPDGRILWRDEEVLSALEHEDAGETVLAPAIVLTSTAEPESEAPAPLPEIVARVAVVGDTGWGVELGSYPTRFDAERVLLRLALSESTALGGGTRHVASRGGAFVAEVLDLSENMAQLACMRLIARDHPCSVMTP